MVSRPGGDIESRAGGPERDERSAGAARDEEHDAFGEKLSHQATATGTDREPHRNLASTRRGAGQQHIGHVGAGNQEDERGEDQQYSHEPGHGTDCERGDGSPAPQLEAAGPGGPVVTRDRREAARKTGLRLFQGHTGREPAHHLEPD